MGGMESVLGLKSAVAQERSFNAKPSGAAHGASLEYRDRPCATYSRSTNSHHRIKFYAMSITKLFAQNVRELLLERGFSQEELAHRAGLHRTYVGAVERGERNITLLNAQRIAEALGVALDRCVRLNDEKRKRQITKRS